MERLEYAVISEMTDDFARDHILELIRAEEQGLLIKLPPCKLGDIIYEVDLPEYGIIHCEVARITYTDGYMCNVKSNGENKGIFVEVKVIEGHGKGSGYSFGLSEFGKSVFLTQAEAEKALLKGSISNA